MPIRSCQSAVSEGSLAAFARTPLFHAGASGVQSGSGIRCKDLLVKRAAAEKVRTTRVWLLHKRLDERLGRTSALEVGRFRKGLRVGGCGNSRCWLCHGGKIAGDPKVDARRSLATYREEMRRALRPDSTSGS